jgi:hypothetical protein
MRTNYNRKKALKIDKILENSKNSNDSNEKYTSLEQNIIPIQNLKQEHFSKQNTIRNLKHLSK